MDAAPIQSVSDRLVTNNGIYLMGLAGIGALLYTRGDIATLVVMYSINVFITFSLTELGMSRHWIRNRATEKRWKRQIAIHGTGLAMCLSILGVLIFEKFAAGGWITLVVTGVVIAVSFRVRAHYEQVKEGLKRLDGILTNLPLSNGAEPLEPVTLDPSLPTAVISVTSFSGFGLHQILAIHKSLPGYFSQFMFASAAVVDSGNFKGIEEIAHLEQTTEQSLRNYVTWARAHGFAADFRMAVGTEAVATMEELSLEIARRFPRAIFFMGRLIFREEKWYHRLLHNETPHAIQRRLQFQGIQAMVMPVRVL